MEMPGSMSRVKGAIPAQFRHGGTTVPSGTDRSFKVLFLMERIPMVPMPTITADLI